jgi:hypothetical protein
MKIQPTKPTPTWSGFALFPNELRQQQRKEKRRAYVRAWRKRNPEQPRKKRDLNGLSKDHAAYMHFWRQKP